MKFRKALKQVVRFMAVVLGLTACTHSGLASHSLDWKEEVLLHDGRTVIAERHYSLGGYPSLDSTQRSVVNETTVFRLPGTGQAITWKSDFRDGVPEPNSLNILLFDIVNDIPYVATYPAGCIAYNKWQRPNPFYILFRHEKGAWKRIALDKFPAELTSANVIVGGPVHELAKPYYTAEAVNLAKRYLEPKYKTILREVLKDPVGRCGEMISDGQGRWIGIGWFSDQPSLEACLKYCKREKMPVQYCPCENLFKDAN